MRWIVGDLQGCARELEDLLRTIRFDRGRDELWSVGDLINKGPASLRTLEIWHDLGGRGARQIHTLVDSLSDGVRPTNEPQSITKGRQL